ncbi:hypothetical protein [Moorena sp. SIO4G3]|nr:hypothetical protein [Moorena sp. SIO4G3]
MVNLDFSKSEIFIPLGFPSDSGKEHLAKNFYPKAEADGGLIR